MEPWKVDFDWLEVRHKLKDLTGKDKLPDLNAILFMIGIQELGEIRSAYSKEEKQDLMHIAVCRLLSTEGYYQFEGIDADGWPHWKLVKKLPFKGLKEQEELLKVKVVEYFKQLEKS